jgi:hypothetical protein
MGAVAKSYMRKVFLIYEELRRYLVMYMRRPLPSMDFLVYKENFVFFFIRAA